MTARTAPRTLAPIAGSVLLALTLAGCSGAAIADAPEATPSDLPAQNVADWTMPLDAYIPVDTHAADYAENLLVEPCMTQHGYTWDVPQQTIATSPGATENAAGRRIFNRSIAAVWGYHEDPSAGVGPDAAWRAFAKAHIHLTDAEESTLVTCIAQARSTLPRLPGAAQYASSLGSKAVEQTQKDHAVAQAASRWHNCTTTAGLTGVPAAPSDMPSAALAKRFKLDTTVKPSAQEIAFAVQDANCRDSSGYTRTAYETEWNTQVALLESNAIHLGKVREEIASNATSITNVIAEHAPR